MRPPRNSLNLNLPAQFRRSHADLYELTKVNNFAVNARLFLEQAQVELEVQDKVLFPQSMPQTESDRHYRWPSIGRTVLRRPSSEPISIANFADSLDHEFEGDNPAMLTTEQGLVRHLVENCGQAVCGSPIKVSYLANYRPSTTESSLPSANANEAKSATSTADIDLCSIASTTLLDFQYDEEDDEVFHPTDNQYDDELVFPMEEFEENSELVSDYRRIFTSLQNIPQLQESAMADLETSNESEDEVDSGPGEVFLDRELIVRGEEPRVEVDPIEEVANRRMRVIREVAAELRQISLDYERRVRLRNIGRRLHFQSLEPEEPPLKQLLNRLRLYLLNKFESLKQFVETILRAAFQPAPILQ